jgi:hypothetical protein
LDNHITKADWLSSFAAAGSFNARVRTRLSALLQVTAPGEV